MTRMPVLAIINRLPWPNWPTGKSWLDRVTLLTMMDRKARPNRQTDISSME